MLNISRLLWKIILYRSFWFLIPGLLHSSIACCPHRLPVVLIPGLTRDLLCFFGLVLWSAPFLSKLRVSMTRPVSRTSPTHGTHEFWLYAPHCPLNLWWAAIIAHYLVEIPARWPEWGFTPPLWGTFGRGSSLRTWSAISCGNLQQPHQSFNFCQG